MHIVSYRKHGDLNCQTRVYGPFVSEEDAYEFLGSLPAVGYYDELEHQGQHGHKYIIDLIAPEEA